MALHVVHTQGRNAPGKSQRLSARSPNQKGSDQSRPRRVGDGINLCRHTISLSQHLTNQGQHAFDVIP